MEPQEYRATGEGGAAAYPGAGESVAGGSGGAERVKDEMRRGVQTAKDEATAVAQQARQHAGEVGRQVKDQVTETARAAAEQTKRKAAEYADQARTRGVQMLDEQRHTAASQLQTVGEAVHRAADKFREDRDDNIAGYVDALADEVDRCARYLEQRDMGALVHDTQRFARRNPELFLGGMFLAGLALSRFLKASRPETDGQQYMGGGGEPSWGRESGREGMGSSAMDISSQGISPPNMAETTLGGGSTAAMGVSGMSGSAASDTTMPSSIGESGTACGPVEQQ